MVKIGNTPTNLKNQVMIATSSKDPEANNSLLISQEIFPIFSSRCMAIPVADETDNPNSGDKI
jgi:hypothetical protein